MDHLVSPVPLQRSQARPTATNALWGHILRKTGSSQVPPSTATSTSTLGKHTSTIAPIDKAGASTRILLHDTQAHLERFTDRVSELVTDLDCAKRELVGVQKLYVEDHEQLMDRMIGLTNRSQTELQKSIGDPAQSPQVRDLVKDISQLSRKVGALEKKIDSLNVLNQTQLQAMQTIQDQQGQILTTIGPLLPLLQAMPLHVENARNHVKDAVMDLRQEVLSRMAETSTATGDAYAAPVVSRISRAESPGLFSSGDSGFAQQRKKRRLESSLELLDSTGTTGRKRPHDISMLDSSARLSTDRVSQSLRTLDIPLLKRSSRANFSAAPVSQMVPVNHAASPLTSPAGLPISLTHKHDQHGRNDTLSAARCRPTSLVERPATRSHTAHASSDRQDSPSGGLERSTSYANNPNPASALNLELPTATKPSLTCQLHTPTNPLGASSGSLEPSSGIPFRTPRVGTMPDRTQEPAMPPPSVGKPMSLKDRRAMLADEHQSMGGKRFIPLDDDEDESEELAM
ncbi:hypothetical protein C8Q70DRAFT_1058780 [Cubamyces menziesii]|nr:hypothetical protein C8Q70DRAFT_1058780 [Cubamyces menziesii]